MYYLRDLFYLYLQERTVYILRLVKTYFFHKKLNVFQVASNELIQSGNKCLIASMPFQFAIKFSSCEPLSPYLSYANNFLLAACNSISDLLRRKGSEKLCLARAQNFVCLKFFRNRAKLKHGAQLIRFLKFPKQLRPAETPVLLFRSCCCSQKVFVL